MRSIRRSAVAAVIGVAIGGGACAQTPPALGHTAALVLDTSPARGGATLRVSTPAFAAGGTIPIANTQYGYNRFPGLAWSTGPRGTRSYAVIVQGAVGHSTADGTSIHLTVFNLPVGTTALPAGLAALPDAARYGPNIHGIASPYAGPHTHNAILHDYHFEVFALDRLLTADPATPFDALVEQMRGHVLASGEVVGRAAGPERAADPAGLPPVRIDTGLVSGIPGHAPAVTVYKGIPFAAPPIGPLRWRPPAPAAAWAGVRKADRFGPICAQPGGPGPARGPMSEDCLTLNVWTGAAPGASEKRPVFVWIYGGGFIGGSGSSPEFDGEGLANKGVIVVTFNYRVGALGFLATPALSAESDHGASGNYGILDDIAALQWVRRNIAAFGGDPTRVTIGGQSAGAGSVGFLTQSPLAKGLFQRGIEQSHARYPRDPDLRYLSVSYRPLHSAEAAGAKYAAEHGATSPAELRAMPWEKLVEGSNTFDASIETGSSGKPPLFRPVVDGWVIPHTYVDMLAGHTQNDVMIVAGNNRDESGAVPETAFATLKARTDPPRAGMPETNVTLAGYRDWAHRKFGALADVFLSLYPAHDDDSAALQNDAAARDDNRVSTWLWATEWSKGVTKPVYTYWWDHAAPGRDAALRGAYHGSEINYVFDNLYATDRPWTDEDRRIAETMSSYWANVIKSGNPNAPGLPEWHAFDPKSATVMELGNVNARIPVAGPEKIAFWRRFFATQDAW